MNILLSPHNDDETLFASYTIIKEKPLVVVVFDGHLQARRGHDDITPTRRRLETHDALKCLGHTNSVNFLGLRDDALVTVDDIVFRLRSCIDLNSIERVYAPVHDADGHAQHNLVAQAGAILSPDVASYCTYTRGGGKQRSDNEVIPESGDWIRRKHNALACYESQYTMAPPSIGCWPWFMEDMREYRVL